MEGQSDIIVGTKREWHSENVMALGNSGMVRHHAKIV